MTSPAEAQEVCIVGVFRSGTNVTKSVVDEAFGITATFSSVFWKHQIIPTLLPRAVADTLFITVVKNPLHQLVSWFDYAKATPRSMRGADTFSEFIRSPIQISEGAPRSPRYYFDTPLSYWNQYYFTCADLAERLPRKFALVRYEDMLESPKATVRRLQDFIGRDLVKTQVAVPDVKLRNMRGDAKFEESLHTHREKYDASIVSDRKYLSAYSAAEQEWVWSNVIDSLRPLYTSIDKQQNHMPSRTPPQ